MKRIKHRKKKKSRDRGERKNREERKKREPRRRWRVENKRKQRKGEEVNFNLSYLAEKEFNKL